MKYEPPFPAFRGQTLYHNTGELSFDTSPREAGTFKVTFLKWICEHTAMSETPAWWAHIINQRNRLEVVHSSLISRFNI